MLPRVKITYANGALGQVEAMADGCLGFIALGASAEGDFKLQTPYTIRKVAELEALGVTSENNQDLYRHVKDFYAEAGNGVELWIMGFDADSQFKNVLDKDNVNGAMALIQASNGKIRGLVAFKKATSQVVQNDVLDADVTASIAVAQGLGDQVTEELRAPIFILLEGNSFNGNTIKLDDLTEASFNRVGIVIGDTIANSRNACMGIVAGRLAISPVQRKISRVKDGALTPQAIYIADKPAEVADVETIHEKGYITFRTFVGKSGYFIADDNLATAVEDDYRSLSNRRVIDKAYRIAYNTLTETLNDEVPISSDGKISPSWCASLQGDVEQAIISNMTTNGNLGNDPADTNDTGVQCYIDHNQPILTNSKLAVSLRVKPNGYAKYIDTELGFKTV
ncbi:MAG: DUF2586 domain-containing protein [Tannerellaceae bacterium]|nr:DUF2586 domain-containing protein [Tannerellaceae bacterium]